MYITIVQFVRFDVVTNYVVTLTEFVANLVYTFRRYGVYCQKRCSLPGGIQME